MFQISNHIKKELELLCTNHSVNELFLFGSALRNDFNPLTSDLDFLVQFSNKIDVLAYSKNYFSFQFALEELFKKPIHLMTIKELKNPILIAEINKSKQLLYAA